MSGKNPGFHQPNMSDLRIVLLGKTVSENSLVGNFILGRAAFDSEAPPDVVERVGGRLKDRHLIIINSPQLLQRNISDHQITHTVRECVFLSDPGPHVFIIILQYNDFTEEDLRRVKTVLKEFSEEAVKRTIVITTNEEKHHAKRASVKVNEFFQQLIEECGGGNVQYKSCIKFCYSEIFKRIEKILKNKKINDEYLRCNTLKDAKNIGSSVGREDGGSVDPDLKKMEEQSSVNVTRKQKLNLVLCGSDETLKKSISELIKEKREDMELHDHLINLLELPALTGLSEEEVMRQTIHCVSLCHPGVHVFLLIIPDDNEDKAEIEEFQKRFSSRINKHIMILKIKPKNIMQMISKMSSLNFLPTEAKTSLQMFGGQQLPSENSSQVPDLLQEVENMVKLNNGSCYTTFMYLQAQVELERNKHRAEIEELRRSVMKTAAGVIHNHDEDDGGVRIVLLGKTGVGKSATGNTILRRKAFTSKLISRSVTRECQKETSEFNRRQISVIDTPGLFDTGVDNDEIRKEIVKCVLMAAPGPHVFLLVIQLGRFTKEEKDAVKMIQESFGDQSRMYTMVLFSRGDDLGGTTIEDFIKDDDSLQYLIQQYGHRYYVFNNNETEDQTQVSELLDKIDCMVAVNGGSFYTNEMFQQVEKNIREEQERILKEKEEEIKKKEKDLRDKYEAKIEQMKKENERERQVIQNELRKSEEEFKIREEEIKKEMDNNVRKELQTELEENKKKYEEEFKRKEKDLVEQQQNFIKHMEDKREKENQLLLKKMYSETREQAVCENLNNLTNRAKLAHEWGNIVPVLGGAAGGLYGGFLDWLKK